MGILTSARRRMTIILVSAVFIVALSAESCGDVPPPPGGSTVQQDNVVTITYRDLAQFKIFKYTDATGTSQQVNSRNGWFAYFEVTEVTNTEKQATMFTLDETKLYVSGHSAEAAGAGTLDQVLQCYNVISTLSFPSGDAQTPSPTNKLGFFIIDVSSDAIADYSHGIVLLYDDAPGVPDLTSAQRVAILEDSSIPVNPTTDAFYVTLDPLGGNKCHP